MDSIDQETRPGRMAVLGVAVLHPIRPSGIRGPLGHVPGIELRAPDSEAGFVRAVQDECPAVLIAPHWRPDYWNASLRWVAAVGAGHDTFPVTQFAERGVVLTTAKGLTAAAVAEHAFALLLALARRVPSLVDSGRARSWVKPAAQLELNGSKLTVLGLGEIGERIARIGAAFGMNVVGMKRDPSGYSGAASAVYPPSALADAIRGADVVINALPGGGETAKLLDRAILDEMRGAFFINVGRGSTVDEQALLSSLESGALLGAGLDVFEVEPLPVDSRLWEFDNVIVSPHVGGSTPHYGERWLRQFLRNVHAFAEHGAWENRIV